ncbi:hypothetical protein AMTRI_Chr05g67900 [Amborella trichopoda]|nr:putative leucine-rich repeat receptor-like protein kinase At2g19210 [Amborella trichopoda]|eukprot:XP_006853769.3 putative leucine-rich repeat receptor-like protein kinase At2g19210 [Amborella trichopoda]
MERPTLILSMHLLGLLCFTYVVCGHHESIYLDCGYLGDEYQDPSTTIHYTSDAKYIDTGEPMTVDNPSSSTQYQSLRAFKQGKRNCYNVTDLSPNSTYLIRAWFMHGNYDSSFRLPKFDLYLGVDRWFTVTLQTFQDQVWTETMSTIVTDYVAVCLVNTDLGTPFISALDLRPLASSMYPVVNASRSLTTLVRKDIGSLSHTALRYKLDPYDRVWEPYTSIDWVAVNFSSFLVDSNDEYQPPAVVMETAARPSDPNGSISISWDPPTWDPDSPFFFCFYFFESAPGLRIVVVKLNGKEWDTVNTTIKKRLCTKEPERRFSQYQVTFSAPSASSFPPILNGYEVYVANERSQLATDAGDVAALMDIKDKLRLTNRSWAGDPCLPGDYPWDALTCNEAPNRRIITLDISGSGLNGEIPASIANLNELTSLNLSNNQLTGPIPESFAHLTKLKSLDLSKNNLTGLVPSTLIDKNDSGVLLLSIFQNPSLLRPNSSEPTPKKNKKNVLIVVISVSATIVLLFAFAFVLIMTTRKINGTRMRKRKTSSNSDGAQTFTHSEIVKITNDYEKIIGKGGYGPVFYGRLDDGREVAVKILSKESHQGAKEFSNEVKLLMRVHHKYLASLIGFSEEGKEKILVYEYMSKGNLNSILSDKSSSSKVLNWEQRIQIALSAAQGLEYLHYGCKPPIVHRDVKTSNILLNEKLEAKLADFGLSRFGPTEGDTHISTTVMGTPGYVDPEYYITNKLNVKSDVYSFGIVLLEIISGQPAIIEEEAIHIVQWVTPKVVRGEIDSVIDPKLQGDYDINSAWKAAEIALACTPQSAIKRATMSDVIGELRGCIQLERSRLKRRSSRKESFTSISLESEILFDPSAR